VRHDLGAVYPLDVDLDLTPVEVAMHEIEQIARNPADRLLKGGINQQRTTIDRIARLGTEGQEIPDRKPVQALIDIIDVADPRRQEQQRVSPVGCHLWFGDDVDGVSRATAAGACEDLHGFRCVAEAERCHVLLVLGSSRRQHAVGEEREKLTGPIGTVDVREGGEAREAFDRVSIRSVGELVLTVRESVEMSDVDESTRVRVLPHDKEAATTRR